MQNILSSDLLSHEPAFLAMRRIYPVLVRVELKGHQTDCSVDTGRVSDWVMVKTVKVVKQSLGRLLDKHCVYA